MGAQTGNRIHDKMIADKTSRCIGIYKKALTPSAAKQISDKYTKLPVDMFHSNELIINITKHIYVPLHEVLSAEEKGRILLK